MIYSFIRNKFIFSMTIIDDADESSVNYHRFMSFYETVRPTRGTRRFKLIIAKAKSILAADDGSHWFFHNKRYYWFFVKEMDSSGSEKVKSKVTIYSYGLTIAPLTKLISQFAVRPYTKLGLYGSSRTGRDSWSRKAHLERVTLKDMILDEDLLNEIVTSLDWFMNNEPWYRERFLDYKMVMLLEGPPGTGKSFLIRAIAHYVNRNLHLLDTSDFDSQFMEKANSIPSTGMGLIEDFDDSKNMMSRDTEIEVSAQAMDSRAKGGIKLSTLLNVLQGVNSSNGQVTMLSTNHIEVLDPAIYRPGRVDKIFHIGPMKNELIHRYLERMYDKESAAKYSHYQFTPTIAAKLSQLFVCNPHDIDGFVNGLLETKVIPISKIQ